MAKRLFTFGCSFTQYHWPTWADLLLTQYEGENWGRAGGGNKFIFESLVECDIRNNLTPDDTVVIMWTSFTREDRYLDTGWWTCGNVYNALPLYDDHFLKKYWSDKGCVLNNLNFIYAACKLLDGIGCKWKMVTMVPMLYPEHNDGSIVQDLTPFAHHLMAIKKYDSHWSHNPLYQFSRNVSTQLDKIKWGSIDDHHPTTKIHFEWLKQAMSDLIIDLPKLDAHVSSVDSRLRHLSMTTKFPENTPYKAIQDLFSGNPFNNKMPKERV